MAKSPSLLLIEDDDSLANSLENRLKTEGFTMARATKVGDALWKLRNQTFDCILVDLRLEQGGSGEDIARQLRASPKEPNHLTPILIISGFLDEALVSRLKLLPRTGILVKPIEPRLLLERLSSAISTGGLTMMSPTDRAAPPFVDLDDERKFLHDLATPLATATLLTEEITQCFTELSAPQEAGPRQTDDLKQMLGRMSKLLDAQRDLVTRRPRNG